MSFTAQKFKLFSLHSVYSNFNYAEFDFTRLSLFIIMNVNTSYHTTRSLPCDKSKTLTQKIKFINQNSILLYTMTADSDGN
jgi:predicted permease